jgi:hypothetical protein
VVRHQRAHRRYEHGRDLHGPAALVVHVARFVERRRQEGDGYPPIRFANAGGGVLIVEVESEVRVEVVGCGLEDLPLGGLKAAGIAVHVDPLGVPPPEPFRAVGIQHGDHMHGGPFRDPARQGIVRSLVEEADDIGQGHGRGAFVAVHLGP